METRFVKYSQFAVASEEDGFRLTIGGYTGNAGETCYEYAYLNPTSSAGRGLL